MRLGKYRCEIQPDTLLRQVYKEQTIYERHRHRFEFNNAYREQFEEKGLKISGINPENNLVAAIEMKGHSWFVGVQFHPELKSRPHRPHPVFREFVKAATEHQEATRPEPTEA